ncbi:MAG: hypothetical protein LBF33_03530, partial [Oscillospiraceae bacterium]|nr:hypothetical protein [Oscillospiraceae bacterium]
VGDFDFELNEYDSPYVHLVELEDHFKDFFEEDNEDTEDTEDTGNTGDTGDTGNTGDTGGAPPPPPHTKTFAEQWFEQRRREREASGRQNTRRPMTTEERLKALIETADEKQFQANLKAIETRIEKIGPSEWRDVYNAFMLVKKEHKIEEKNVQNVEKMLRDKKDYFADQGLALQDTLKYFAGADFGEPEEEEEDKETNDDLWGE